MLLLKLQVGGLYSSTTFCLDYTEIPAVSIKLKRENITKKSPCSSQKYMCWSTSNLQENYNYLINKHGKMTRNPDLQ